MRAGSFPLAWQISDAIVAGRDPATRDDPRLPYHLRWVWDGTPPDGQDVLVRCYHGLGDTLMFARYLPQLARRAASVVVEAPARLIPLLSAFPCRLIPFEPDAPFPPRPCTLEIMDLAHALHMPPDEAPAQWLATETFRFAPHTVGLCLASGAWDRRRSVPPGTFAATPLQRPCIALDLGPSPLAVINPGGCPADLPATAAFVAGCEAVVTVDTMIAHLAGSLGKPTWLMLRHDPDWRWVPGAASSVWYPSLRLVHQDAPGEWEPVVAQVRAQLAL